ncbi:MAG: hypothetical protein ACHQ06_02845 [Candidatus Dormibacteria bacterium]|jgi:hypothetical protein
MAGLRVAGVAHDETFSVVIYCGRIGVGYNAARPAEDVASAITRSSR